MNQTNSAPNTRAVVLVTAFFVSVLMLVAVAGPAAYGQDGSWTKDEMPIRDQINHLRSLPDDVRARTTKQLALDIRRLPKTANKLNLANGLANLSTEGDFGHDTLQEVATTLADALREQPVPMDGTKPAFPYVELATLVRYEHVQASVDNPQYAAAIARLEGDDQARETADFTLTDLQGKSWTLRGLHGKVVLVNFWATWCPPCRKEMPDLDALYKKFKNAGLVVLAISDEDMAKVKPFLTERPVTYPILLDPGRKANDLFHIDGIPKSFVYDREGKLVSQSIDMRTQKQFLEMLAQAGLR
ncbi:MAG TPA: TlpA disulfide reductase family protein [Pyrinomonadaceae bacterium]|nr:TlpA disulfide reductase family protein [Pyrinomonadaceae bacterium]